MVMTDVAFPALHDGMHDEMLPIKMGYPVLWTALLVPLALRLGRKRRPAAAVSDAVAGNAQVQ
jgi:hypothetical protein